MISLTVHNVRTSINSYNYYTFKEKDGFQIIDIKGTSSLNANIDTAQLSGIDGSYFIHSKINERNIVISIRINSSSTRTVEENRIELFKIFKVKEPINLEFVTEVHDVFIDGYVESIECDTFSESEIMQVSIICPKPYFYGELQTCPFMSMTSLTVPYMLAPPELFASNYSDVDIGFYMRITINRECEHLRVTNGYESFYITGFSQGDVLEVNTRQGEKTVKLNGELYFNGFSGDYIQIKPRNNTRQIAVFSYDGTLEEATYYEDGISGYIEFRSNRRGI